MRLLLDTNALLWVLAGSPRIDKARAMILDPAADVFVSCASWWEIAIKSGLGKLTVDLPTLRAEALGSGFVELPILGNHTEAVKLLPPLHRDPFDRMLVAQAISEPMKLISSDQQLAAYTDLVFLI